MSHNMVNFGPPAAKICWRIGPVVWGTLVNFSGFRVLAALLHGTVVVVGVSQTVRRWTEDATYIRQGGHHVGHWPTFLVTAALWNRAGHYIFMMWFLSSIFFSFYLFFWTPFSCDATPGALQQFYPCHQSASTVLTLLFTEIRICNLCFSMFVPYLMVYAYI